MHQGGGVREKGEKRLANEASTVGVSGENYAFIIRFVVIAFIKITL